MSSTFTISDHEDADSKPDASSRAAALSYGNFSTTATTTEDYVNFPREAQLNDSSDHFQSAQLESILKHLETRLQRSLQTTVAGQLQALQDVPKQLISMTAMMSKMDIKIDSLKHHQTIPTDLDRRRDTQLTNVSMLNHTSSDGARAEALTDAHFFEAPALASQAQTRHPSITSSIPIPSLPIARSESQSRFSVVALSREHSRIPGSAHSFVPPMSSSSFSSLPCSSHGRPSVLMMRPPPSSQSVRCSLMTGQVPLRNVQAGINDDDETGSVGTAEHFPSLCGSDEDLTRRHEDIPGTRRVSAVSWSMGRGFSMSVRHLESDEKVVFAGVIDPDSALRLTWDAMIVLNSAIACIVIPLVLVYYSDIAVPSVLRFMFLYLFDIFWILDVFINFRTGFFSGGRLRNDQRSIARRYMSGWLLPDLISTCPMVFFDIGSRGSISNAILKLPRLIQIQVRLSHLRAERCGDISLQIVIGLLITSHLMACFWRVFVRFDGMSSDIAEDFGGKYVKDLYWVSMTLTSTGYGDILPSGSASQLYAIMVMLLGCVGFGALVSGCGFLVRRLFDNEAERKITELTRFMVRRSVPSDLQRRVQFNLRQHFQYKAATAMSPHLLMSLSPAMQRELCLSILSNTVLNFPLFRNAQRSFVAELAQAHCWSQVLTGDLVTDEGCAVQEVIFVIHGSLQAWTPKSYDDGQFDVKVDEWIRWTSEVEKNPENISKCAEVPTGAWFGEASIFDQQRVYTSMIVAITACELAVLPSNEYLSIVQKFPFLWKRHQKIELEIRQGIVSLSGLQYQKAVAVKDERASRQSSRASYFQWSLFSKRSLTTVKAAAVKSYYEGERDLNAPSQELHTLNESEEGPPHDESFPDPFAMSVLPPQQITQ